MIKKTIKNISIIVIFILILSTAVLADNNGSKIEKTIDGIKVNLILSDNTTKTGVNKLTINLYDRENRPLENAKVKVTADMPGDNMDNMKMAHSKPKAVEFNTTNKKGEYTGNISFSDKGNWRIKTDFMAGNQKKTVYFNIKVNNSSPNWYPIIGVLGVIILIVIIVIIRKNKKMPSYENDFQ